MQLSAQEFLDQMSEVECLAFPEGPLDKYSLWEMFRCDGLGIARATAMDKRGNIVGYALLLPTTESAYEIARLAVHPSVWRRGVGTSLLTEVISMIPERGPIKIRCRCPVDNYDLHGFLSAYGFRLLKSVAYNSYPLIRTTPHRSDFFRFSLEIRDRCQQPTDTAE